MPARSVRGQYSEWYRRNVEGDKAKNGPWRQYHKNTYGESSSSRTWGVPQIRV